MSDNRRVELTPRQLADIDKYAEQFRAAKTDEDKGNVASEMAGYVISATGEDRRS